MTIWNDRDLKRWLPIFGAGALGVALVGMFTSFNSPPKPRVPHQVQSAVVGEAPRAPTYREIRGIRMGYNRNRHPDALTTYLQNLPDANAQVDPALLSDQARQEALTHRQARRAYDGAPPTIPHPIDTGEYPNCAVCHERGANFAGLVAPAMPHGNLGSCTQCHVSSSPDLPFALLTDGPPYEDNRFTGREPPNRGERAWPGAPPTMPHSSWMRDRCESCHGVYASGIRSSHPWRQSCQQCHAPSATLDQRPLADLGPAPSQ